tara:strand:+ start:88 stop:225 length:138 start_codon:yes stop_codon:yes gene_type:complete
MASAHFPETKMMANFTHQKLKIDVKTSFTRVSSKIFCKQKSLTAQ